MSSAIHMGNIWNWYLFTENSRLGKTVVWIYDVYLAYTEESSSEVLGFAATNSKKIKYIIQFTYTLVVKIP